MKKGNTRLAPSAPVSWWLAYASRRKRDEALMASRLRAGRTRKRKLGLDK